MAQTLPSSLVYAGDYDSGAGTLVSPVFVNSTVGWDFLFNAGFRGDSTVIGNLEAGRIWSGHEVFARPPGSPTGFYQYTNDAPGSVNEADFHATMVGHVLAGSGYRLNDLGQGVYTYAGLGMAPGATLVSGGVATSFSATNVGAFSTSTDSVLGAYADFFQGTNLGGAARPDVINSSWGGEDPAAAVVEALAVDALARQNPSVALVAAAGNGGAVPVSWPGSGYNNVTVASLGGADFLTPSSFSSRGLVDFYNPQTGVTHTGVRVAVDLAAPGENFFLAAYLGLSGGLGAVPAYASFLETTPSTGRYFIEQSGTSFASPIVAGGIALLKDVGKRDTNLRFVGQPEGFDTRVVKSVLMAGARETHGWDNGQNAFNVTTQALDAATGAGSLDLVAATEVYVMGTRDVVGNAGGWIQSSGWDLATLASGNRNDYAFDSAFLQPTNLTVALNWFVDRDYDANTLITTDVSFANFDLQVWLLDALGGLEMMVGESRSLYNNTEFLRLDALNPGNYAIRVLFNGMIYDTLNQTAPTETFSLAWRAVAIPEPAQGVISLLVLVIPSLWRRRHA